jgi:hypothetical protein
MKDRTITWEGEKEVIGVIERGVNSDIRMRFGKKKMTIRILGQIFRGTYPKKLQIHPDPNNVTPKKYRRDEE